MLDGDKRCFINKEECSFSYRESVFKQKSYLILRVVLKFELGNREELEKTSKEIIKKREVKYHPGIKCPGSFFKNIIASDLNEEQLRSRFEEIRAEYADKLEQFREQYEETRMLQNQVLNNRAEEEVKEAEQTRARIMENERIRQELDEEMGL